jgi:hypothetical protein
MLTNLLTRPSASRRARGVQVGTRQQRRSAQAHDRDLRLRGTKGLERLRAYCPACRECFGPLPTMQWLPRTGLALRLAWEPSPPRPSHAVLAGRATHVPEAAVTSGIQRTTTVTSRRPVGWARIPDLGDFSGPKLHGMQGSWSGSDGEVRHRPLGCDACADDRSWPGEVERRGRRRDQALRLGST